MYDVSQLSIEVETSNSCSVRCRKVQGSRGMSSEAFQTCSAFTSQTGGGEDIDQRKDSDIHCSGHCLHKSTILQYKTQLI